VPILLSVPANPTTSRRTFTDTASTTGTPNHTPVNVSASAAPRQLRAFPTRRSSDLKTAPATVPQGGGNVTYAITASHTGNTAATGVTVTDTLQARATLVSRTPLQETCAGTATGTFSLGTPPAGAPPRHRPPLPPGPP